MVQGPKFSLLSTQMVMYFTTAPRIFSINFTACSWMHIEVCEDCVFLVISICHHEHILQEFVVIMARRGVSEDPNYMQSWHETTLSFCSLKSVSILFSFSFIIWFIWFVFYFYLDDPDLCLVKFKARASTLFHRPWTFTCSPFRQNLEDMLSFNRQSWLLVLASKQHSE